MTAEPGTGMAGSPPARPDPQARRRWMIAVVSGCGVHLLGFFLFAVPYAPPPKACPQEPVVRWVGSENANEDDPITAQLDLYDPAPLFLPTRWNYASQSGELEGAPPPEEIFGLDRPRLVAREGEPPSMLNLAPRSSDTPETVLERVRWPVLSAVGRRDAPVVPLPARLARVEIRSVANGVIVYALDVPMTSRPSAPAWPDWAPLDMLVLVESGMAVGSPLIVRSSGVEDVDVYFREYVSRTVRPELVLPSGYFQITVGP